MRKIRKIGTVGVVGLGAMGAPVARHVATNGFTVVGFDRRAGLAEAIGGITAAKSPKKLARRSDLVLIAVGFDAEVEDCLFCDDGVLAGVQSDAVIVIASTIAPRTMARIVARAIDDAVHFVDAPMTRGEDAAIAGKLLALVGGDPAAVAAARPVLEAFTDTIHHLGPVGSGQVGKLVNNLILWACISANYEGMMLGEALGVDRKVLREALLRSSAGNWALETGAGDKPMPWAEKDMTIVLQEADALRLNLPLCGLIKEVIKGIKIEKGFPTPQLAS